MEKRGERPNQEVEEVMTCMLTALADESGQPALRQYARAQRAAAIANGTSAEHLTGCLCCDPTLLALDSVSLDNLSTDYKLKQADDLGGAVSKFRGSRRQGGLAQGGGLERQQARGLEQKKRALDSADAADALFSTDLLSL